MLKIEWYKIATLEYWELDFENSMSNVEILISRLQCRESNVEKRVPALSLRDCAGSPNNFVLRSKKLSALGMTAKDICERLVLGSGPRRFVPFVIMSYAPTHTLLIRQLFLDIPCLFAPKLSRSGPLKQNSALFQ